MACAQNGLEVSLNSLNLAVPPPRFVRNDFICKNLFNYKDQGWDMVHWIECSVLASVNMRAVVQITRSHIKAE